MILLESRPGRPAEKTLIAIRNDTFNEIIRVWDDNGEPYNLTGSSFLLQAKRYENDEEVVIDIDNSYFILGQDEEGINSGVYNLVIINFPPENMNISPEEYVYDLQVTRPTNTKRTILRGPFIVEADISE